MSIDRRRFLLLGAAAAAARAAAPNLQLGFSLYAMKDFEPGDALEICGRLGYQCVELTLNPGWPTEPKLLSKGDRGQLRAQLVDLDVGLAGLMEKILLTADDAEHAENIEKIRRAAELAHDLSPAAPPPLETVLGGRPEQWDELKDAMAERLADWKKVAEEVELTIAIKPHVRSAAHLPEHALWLLRQVRGSRLRAVYDYSHYSLQGLDMPGTLRDLGPEIAFVHVKDAAGTAEKPEFLLPGEGGTNYPSLFEGLARAGYEGPVVVEVSGQLQAKPDYDPIRAAEQSYEALAEALQAAGETSR